MRLAEVDEAKENTRLEPEKLLSDGQYTTAANFMGAESRDLELVGNIREPANPKGGYPLSLFHYDTANQTLTCPAGVVTSETYRSENIRSTIFCFPEERCNICSLKEKCTGSNNGRRVSINDGYSLILQAKDYLRTVEGKADLKARPRDRTGKRRIEKPFRA